MMNYVNYFIHIVKTMLPIMKDSLLHLYYSNGALFFFGALIFIAVIIVEQKIADYVYEKLPINKPTQVIIRIIAFILGSIICITYIYFSYINEPNLFFNREEFYLSVATTIEIARIAEVAWAGILYLVFKLIGAIKEDTKQLVHNKA